MKLSDVQLPSNRKFGTLFVVIFVFLAGYFSVRDNNNLFLLFTGLALITLFIILLIPSLLLPFNKLWMYIGLFLGMIISPLVLAIIFYVIFSPIGIITRIFGRDELGIKNKPRKTFWKIKKDRSSFKYQY